MVDYITTFLSRMVYNSYTKLISTAIDEIESLAHVRPESLVEYKITKISALYNYIIKQYPCYLELIADKSDFSEVSRLIDIQKLPILSKDEFKRNINGYVDEKLNVSWRSTSGTTGSPLTFPKDQNAKRYMDAMMFDAYSWHGIYPYDKQARLWGRALNNKGRFIQLLKDTVLNRKRLSAFAMDAKNCIAFFKVINKYKPKYFYAYANALYQFANIINNEGLNGKELNINIAICTGEVLFPHQRQYIESVFGCRVVNEYGSTENGIIAFECEYGNMHILPTVYVEIVNPNEHGFGEIVVTELNSRSLPFLRYRNGDTGRILPNDCKCNRPYETIEIFEGRIDSYIRCPNGRMVYDALLAYTFKDYVEQFKAFQYESNSLEIYVIPKISLTKQVVNKIANNLKEYLGPEMNVEIIIVDKIDSEKSGKHKYFVSYID